MSDSDTKMTLGVGIFFILLVIGINISILVGAVWIVVKVLQYMGVL